MIQKRIDSSSERVVTARYEYTMWRTVCTLPCIDNIMAWCIVLCFARTPAATGECDDMCHD